MPYIKIGIGEIESIVTEYISKQIGKSVVMSGLNFKEVADCYCHIDWDRLNDIELVVKIEESE